MAITGTWRNQRLWVDQPTALGRPEYSEMHATTDWTEPGSRPPYAVGRMDSVPAAVDDPGTAYDPVGPSQAPGVVLDLEPLSHDGDGGSGGMQSVYAAQAKANAARSVSRGADRRQLYKAKTLWDRGETHTTDALTVDPISAGSVTATLRGRNSLPENNPEGFRYGTRVQRWTDRKVWNRHRHHDLRPVRDFLAASAVQSPELEKTNRNTSPFSWNARQRSRKESAPVQRRVPRPWDEAAETDGVTEYDGPAVPAESEYQSWGL